MVPFQHPRFGLDLEPERVLDLESVFVLVEGPPEVAALVVAALLGSASGWCSPQSGRPCSQSPASEAIVVYYEEASLLSDEFDCRCSWNR